MQVNQQQKREQVAKELVNKSLEKQGKMLQNQMMQEQLFNTYKAEKDTYSNKWPLSPMHELDTKVFNDIKSDLSVDKRYLPDGDMDVNVFMNKKLNDTKAILTETDNYQKLKGYKSVDNVESMMKENFSFTKYVLTKEQVNAIKGVKETDYKSIESAKEAINEAINKCSNIKTKARQKASDENFKDFKLSGDDEKKISNLEHIWNLLSDLNKPLETTNSKQADAIFGKSRFRNYESVEVTFEKDGKNKKMNFDWNKEKIIKTCMISNSGKSVRSMKKPDELRAFTDELTVAIARIIAEFLSEKYNINPAGDTYEKLLTYLVSTRVFDKKHAVVKVENLGMKTEDNIPLKELDFTEVFKANHDILDDLLKLRNYSEDVLDIEEDKAYREAGSKRVDDLSDTMVNAQTNLNNTFLTFLEQVSKELNANEEFLKKAVQDPKFDEETKAKYQKMLDDYIAYKQKTAVSSKKFDLKGRSINDIKLTDIEVLDKKLSYIDMQAVGTTYLNGIQKMESDGEEYGRNYYTVGATICELINDFNNLVKITIQKNPNNTVTRTIHLNISDAEVTKLGKSMRSLKNVLRKMAENVCQDNIFSHPEFEEYADGTKNIRVDKFFDGELEPAYEFMLKKLQSDSIGSIVLTTFSEVRKTWQAIGKYRSDLEDIISKKEDIREYYSNIDEVESNLNAIKERLDVTYIDPAMYQKYLKANELKDRFEATLAVPADIYRSSRGDKEEEQKKIDIGCKTYKLLEQFEQFKDNLAQDKTLKDSVQGRKLIEQTVLMQKSLVDRIVEEKKEELAFYEGNLLKININDFKEKNGKIVEKIEKARKEEENWLTTGDAEDILEKYVSEYNGLMSNIDTYLERYAELKNNSYYVKQVAVVKEALTRQIRSIDNVRILGCYKEVQSTDTFSNCTYKGAYKVEANLADKYKKFVEKISGREKIGTYQNIKKLDRDVDKRLEINISDDEVKGGLDAVLDIALVSTRMQKAGLNSDGIMQKMNYPGNIMQDINVARGTGTFISVLSDKEAAKEWFKAKADQFVEYYKQTLEVTKAKAAIAFKDRGDNACDNIANYIVAQTQVGAQIEVIQQIGDALKFNHKDFADLYGINLKDCKKEVAQAQGFEEENSSILFDDGLNAYSELKLDNNREVIYKIKTQPMLDKLNTFNSDINKDGLSFAPDYEKLLEVEKLRSSNSKEFNAVLKASKAVYEQSAAIRAQVISPESYSQKDVAAKIKGIDNAYEELLKATKKYIETRSVIYRGHSDAGKARLAAIREIEEHAKAQRSAYTQLQAPLIDYKKDETVDVSALVQKLAAFKAEKKDMFYDAFLEFKNRFKDQLNYNGGEETLDSRAGVQFFVDLKKEEMLLHKQAVNEIIAESEKIRLDCTKTDTKASRTTLYSKWIRCFDFYNKYESSCPQEAKEAVESIRVLAQDYLNGRDAEGVVTNLKAEKEALHNFAIKIKDKVALSKEDKAQIMWLRFRYNPFMTGAKKYKDDYKKDSAFINDYKTVFEDFDLITKEVNSYTTDPNLFKESIQAARDQLDSDLAQTREVVASQAYVLTNMKDKAAVTIKNTLEKILYVFYLYNQDKENSGISEDEIKFYNAQKVNLEELLTGNIAKMLVEEDYGAVYEKKGILQKPEAGYTTSLKNIELVDKRMEEYKAYINKKPEEMAKEKITEEDQVSHTLRYIVQVEAENIQLQGVQTLSKTSVHMAEELEKQLKVRTDFEKHLLNLKKETNKDKIAVVMNAMVSTAGDYYKLLKNKEDKILSQHLNTDQERMLYYFASFSKYCDEAKIYLSMIKKWSHTLGVRLSGPNYTKLADIVGRIDLKAKENIKYNYLTDADLNTKKKLGDLKNEATLAAYTTQKVCNERDQDFAYTMQNLKDVKLNSVNNFRVNDLVKNSRKFGGDKRYDSLKVDKSKNFTLFGFTLWGKVDHSLNDFIARVFKYTMKYKELIEPLENLIKLGDYPSFAIAGDAKTRAVAAEDFTKLVQDINCQLLNATSDMVSNHSKEGHRRSNYRIQADRRYLMEGWTDFYQTFKELGVQLNDYLDRNPKDKDATLNSKVKDNYDTFADRMADIGSGATDIASQEKRFFTVMKYINENQYAESAYERSCNVQYRAYRDYLVSWFENLCYKEALSALRGINMTTNAEVAAEQYGNFLKTLEKYAASKAISVKTHNYLKSYVFNACKKKYPDMADKSIEELAQIRASVVFDNAIAEFGIENIAKLTPETRERWEKLGYYDPKLNKLNGEFLKQIQKIAYNAALIEIRGTKTEKVADTSETLVKDSAEFLAAAQKVTYSVGGWWFILKDYFNYAIGETQAAYFKVKNA